MSRLTFKNYSAETTLFHRRLLAAVIVILILSLALLSRLVYLQIIQHKLYTTLSDQNQFNLIPIEPNRGLIYDRHGVLLAENKPVFSLDIIPNRVGNFKNTLKKLEQIIQISPDDIEQYKKSLAQHHRFDRVPLKLKLTEDEVARFYLNQYRFPGVVISARMMRYYPEGDDVVSAIGYVGRINEQELRHLDAANYSASNYIGKIGLEKHYENELHGTVGYQQVETDASGRIIRVIKEIPPIPGHNLYLTLDSRLQKVAQQALGDDEGAVVMIQPSTGQVLAFASNPGYDPNLFARGITDKEYQGLQNDPHRPLYNRALRGLYPSGSTVKPFFAIQGLNTKTVTPSFTIFDPGYFRLPGSSHIFHDWWKGGHGMVDLHKAIVVSCDTYFFTLAFKMGIQKMDQVLDWFGFGKLTGIDLDEELPGIVPSPAWKKKARGEIWYPGDTVNFGIGQGYFLVTPLQLAHAVATIANRGTIYRPTLVLKQQLPDGKMQMQQPIIDGQVKLTDPSIWDTVISAMQGVITEPHGTGSVFRLPKLVPYTIAGKTGTAEVAKPMKYKYLMSNVGIPKQYLSHALFIAFAPIDHPQVAIAVLVEHNPHQAVVVARKVLDYYFLQEPKELAASQNSNANPTLPNTNTSSANSSSQLNTTTSLTPNNTKPQKNNSSLQSIAPASE